MTILSFIDYYIDNQIVLLTAAAINIDISDETRIVSTRWVKLIGMAVSF